MHKTGDILMLWQGTAPYSEFSPGQAQPSLKAFPAEGSRGAVIVIPGGAYTHKAPHEGDPVARMLNAQGIAAYVLDYRVAPCCCEAPLADVKRAVRILRLEGYEKVAVLGFSAGGNLCCASAVLWDGGDPGSDDPAERLSSRPDVFIPCYAVVSMGQYTHAGSRDNLLGADNGDPELLRRFSAELNVNGDTPPAFIWHTAEDGSVPPQNSLLLAKALADHGIPFELHIYPRGQHGIGLGSELPPAAGWGTDCCRFLLSHGFGI